MVSCPGFWLLLLQFVQSSMNHVDLQEFQSQIRDLNMNMNDFTSDHFEKIGVDVRCDDLLHSRGKSDGIASCKKRCQPDPGCKFFAYWTKTKWCETYETCTTQSADGKKSINLYKRIDPCLSVFDAYLKNIPAAFPSNAVRTKSPSPNIYCSCINGVWMLCVIFVEEDSREEKIVTDRLDPSDMERLFPFMLVDSSIIAIGQDSKPVVYTEMSDSGYPKVMAEIEILNLNRCLHLNTCTKGTLGGACPVTKEAFKSGDAVFILNSDQERATRGVPVPCMSIQGLQRWNFMHKNRGSEGPGFPDIFQRTERLMTRDDYTFNIIFDDDDFARGFCRARKGGMLAEALADDIPAAEDSEKADERAQIKPPPPRPGMASAAGSSSSARAVEEAGSGKSKQKKKKKKKGPAGSESSYSGGSPDLLSASAQSNSPQVQALSEHAERISVHDDDLKEPNNEAKVLSHQNFYSKRLYPTFLILFSALLFFLYFCTEQRRKKSNQSLQVEFYYQFYDP